MSQSSHLNKSLDDEMHKVLEDLTSNVKQIQDDLLEEILTHNANTEYLKRFLHGRSGKELFKKNVPIVTYVDVEPYIERVANGEPSDIISAQPITKFAFRYVFCSGTSGGKMKLLPFNVKYLENVEFISNVRSFVISRHIDGADQGKAIRFAFIKMESTTPSGLPAAPASTIVLKTAYFRNLASKSYTSPNEIILCRDNKQSMYCHLLCGLVRREEVVSVSAAFASALVRAISFLEEYWKELCGNIRMGHVSEWIEDTSCRNCVSEILGGPNPELANLIEKECNQISWGGIICRLWPKTKFVECVITGQMTHYIPTLEFYSNKLPIVSMKYFSSETSIGINLNPLCKPQDVSYTFMPKMAYFEFLLVDEANEVKIVDLVDVNLGCYYEPLVTSYTGLYRYRLGDVLQVSGFYNNAPQFRFVRRNDVALSVDIETTTEEELLKAVANARMVLDSSDLMLTNFTWYADISTIPGHYVGYWELKAKNKNTILDLDKKLMAECCYVLEETFGSIYRAYRSKNGLIGALEIRVVLPGTFDSLMNFFISEGASLVQYKTPICMRSSNALAILEDKVFARFFSDKPPPFDF
ncbi:PREDICTED: 4-substituted benzoates-glutamate ligase GH3.12-like [Camelina sativa]|uniref:4-substituted benzoates-glutamate ligase GH3.12-like n=1 Tax=Camelina sativa TaxID=90675 RepID=A0ABM1RIN6_CAMSA|nr:PREDICTED: 4-substituted benzoates-glutamate ligase GH3.12-like [Camelina sativa]